MRSAGILFLISIAIISYGLGLASVQQNWAPWRVINQAIINVSSFVEGHDEEGASSAFEKLISDRGGVPYRELRRNFKKYPVPEDATPFKSFKSNVLIEGFYKDVPEGYLLVSGAFDFKGKYNNGYVLLNTKGELIRHWLKSGELMTAVDMKRQQWVSAQRVRDWCSDPKDIGKKRLHEIHHSIEIAPDGTYWANSKAGYQQYDPDVITEKGYFKLKREIKIAQIIKANKEMSPLNARLKIRWAHSKNGKASRLLEVKLFDPYHHNDVQPFVDPRFPTELGYALMVSIRHQNMIAVIDPTTLKILWYQQGVTEWQHDVDYFKGSLYAYDNGPFRGYSRLIKFPLDRNKNPATSFEVVIDGRKHDWHQTMRGMYDVIARDGKMFYALTYERDAALIIYNDKQEQVFVAQNILPGNTKHGIKIHGLQYLSPDEYHTLESGCSKKKN